MHMNEHNSETDGGRQVPEGFIRKREVALRVGKTVRTVDAWMRSGVLPYFKIGRSVLFRWSDVEKHIISNYRSQRSKQNRNL